VSLVIRKISSAYDLHYFIYVSQRSTRNYTPNQSELVNKILECSISNNRKLNITWALLACDDWFVQVLEGRRIDVDAIYARISIDPTHKNLRNISAGPIKERQFARWNMCASTLSPTDKAIVDVLKSSGKFDGSRLNGDSAMRLLQAVGRLQAVHEPERVDEGAGEPPPVAAS
jgi:hypothetical protein